MHVQFLSLIHASCISCCMWPCRIEASPTISSKQNNLHTYTRKETIYPCKDDIMVRSYLCISTLVHSSFINPFWPSSILRIIFCFSKHDKSVLSHVSRLSKDRLPAAALMIMLAICLALAETPLMRASACTLFRPSLINQLQVNNVMHTCTYAIKVTISSLLPFSFIAKCHGDVMQSSFQNQSCYHQVSSPSSSV
jgi:hypothetical protein